MKYIIVHGGPAHVDDVLAIALLLTKYPDATVLRVLDEEVQPWLENYEAIVVDIGGQYDRKRLFDHHQDRNLPASFALVLKDIFDIDIHQAGEWLKKYLVADLQDREGFKKALEKYGASVYEVVGAYIVNAVSKAKEIKPGDFLHELLRRIGEFVLEDIRFGLETKEYYDWLMREQRYISTPYGQVLIMDQPQRAYIRNIAPGVLGIIMPARNPQQTAVMSNDTTKFLPAKLKEQNRWPVVFVHHSGFLAVLNVPFNELSMADYQEIVNICLVHPESTQIVKERDEGEDEDEDEVIGLASKWLKYLSILAYNLRSIKGD